MRGVAEGILEGWQWESKEGEKRSAIRVVLDNFEFVDSKQDGQTSGDRHPSSPSNSSPTPQPMPEVSNENASPSSDPDLDEDVPF